MIYDSIVNLTTGNEKRVKKIRSIDNSHEKMYQAERYVVGDLREKKIKISDADIYETAHAIVNSLNK